MQLTCPHCQFSKTVPASQLPTGATRVTCPQCKQSFSLPRTGPTAERPQMECSACGTRQPQAPACSSCGLIFARFRPPQQAVTTPAELPKAGFWVRLVALMIDSFLLCLLQLIFSLILFYSGGNGFRPQGSLSLLIQLFATLLGLFYWVFFTGYGGQTPGKMLLRIQVIGIDGAPLSYGKAFYREVIGKFISGVIFGIGYLMAAFDDQKQALHDRMAKTYVIKL